ncbi:retrovirus-related pol polyprotein from transposon TNT 1-94 [Tanacetum coccineum]
MAFVSSSSSTNEVNTDYRVSTSNTQVSPASTQVSTASTQVSTANLSDDTVYAFLASQPNGSQLVYEDLEQIHEDDTDEMDLKWQLELISMRTRRFFQKTSKKITINGSDTTGYDKNKNQEITLDGLYMWKETFCKAMVAIDGTGFDWSYMADDEVPKNIALMAFSHSKIHNDKTCSKTYLKGLATVEEQLVFYKKNELKSDISYKDSKISMLKSELEKLKKDKESNQLKIENFDNASKILEEFQTALSLKGSRTLRLVANCNYHQRERVVFGNNYTRVNYNYSAKKAHPSAHRNMVPKAVLMQTGLRSLNTVRPVNTTHPKTTVYSARPMSHFSKSAQSTVKRPYQIRTKLTNKNFSQKVNTAKGKFYTARPKAANTARPNSAVVNAVRANQVNAFKASASEYAQMMLETTTDDAIQVITVGLTYYIDNLQGIDLQTYGASMLHICYPHLVMCLIEEEDNCQDLLSPYSIVLGIRFEVMWIVQDIKTQEPIRIDRFKKWLTNGFRKKEGKEKEEKEKEKGEEREKREKKKGGKKESNRNGNSFKLAAQTTLNVDGTSTSLIPGPVTTKEKVQKKNDVKARSMLLMKIVSQLAILGENISQEDLNLKFLRSLPSEWNTHVVVWRNKPDLDTMSFDDLYNNFKIVEQEVKRTESSSSSSQNMAFVSSSSSTNEVNTDYRVSTANTQVSPASTQVSTASTQVSTANLSDDIVYAFLASQPNGSQLVYEDLEQIHEDDTDEMDLKWQLELISMRTRRFFQKTSKKITINGSDTTGYDKSKVECFNCHKIGHFARECRGPRNQDSRNKNQDNSRRAVNVEETSSKAMVAIDGAGFDWSYMADDEVPKNMALMAFSHSKIHNDKTCSKTYLKSFKTLKTQLDDLRKEFNKFEFNLATYKKGLATVEEQLVFYKKNELKSDISYKDSKISMLKSELEKLKKDKESNQLKIENFDNASKSLDKLIGSRITNKSRKGVGFISYNVVPPPHTRLFSPLNLDLSYSSLEEFQQPKFEGYRPKTSKSVSEDISSEVRESPDAPLVEELVSNDKLEKKTISPTVTKMEFVRPKQQEKPVKKLVKYAEMYSFDHVQADYNYHQREKVVSGNNYTRVNYNYSAKKAHPSAHRNMAPRAVLMKISLRPLNTARPVNIAHPKTTVYSARPMSRFSKLAQSTVKRPYQIRTALTNKNFSQKVNTAKGKFYTARPKAVNTARPNSAVVNAVRENQVNAVKASACWVWRPTKLNSASITLKRHNYGHPQKEDQGYVDSGCSRHMTGNMSYLSDFKEFDGGYVTFGGGAKGGKITGKGTLKTVFFFNDTGCFVLSPDFKLAYESQVLLKVPRKNNMYSVDIKNIVPKESVAERRNRTLIDAARTMLADSKLPTTFWDEAVNTACYVQNRVLVVKPHNKTPYELFRGRTPALSFMRPFGCHVTILNTLDYLGKFDGKSDEGFFVGYSLNSKAFRVYNIRTRKVEENLHIRFLEDKPIIAGDGPKWLFDIDVLTKSMNYVPVVAGTNSNDFVGTEESIGAGHSSKETGSSQDYILMPLWKDGSLFDSSSKNASNDEPQPSSNARKKDDEGVCKESGIADQEKPENSTQDVNNVGPKVDMSNITTTYPVPSTPNTRIYKDHSLDHVIGEVQSGVQTRRMTKTTNEQGFISAVYEGKTHDDLHTCLFACFLSQVEPKKVIQALTDPSWIKAMQDELLQFRLQKVYVNSRIKGHYLF